MDLLIDGMDLICRTPENMQKLSTFLFTETKFFDLLIVLLNSFPCL